MRLPLSDAGVASRCLPADFPGVAVGGQVRGWSVGRVVVAAAQVIGEVKLLTQRGSGGDLVGLLTFDAFDLPRLGADRVGLGGVHKDRAVVREDVMVLALLGRFADQAAGLMLSEAQRRRAAKTTRTGS
jgi:hypothetical protein